MSSVTVCMDFVDMILRATDVAAMRKLACMLANQPNEPRVSLLVSEIQKVDEISVGHIIAHQIKNILGVQSTPAVPLQGIVASNNFIYFVLVFCLTDSAGR